MITIKMMFDDGSSAEWSDEGKEKVDVDKFISNVLEQKQDRKPFGKVIINNNGKKTTKTIVKTIIYELV